MSRYLLLLILNLPFLLLFLLNIITRYKLKKIQPRSFYIQCIFAIVFMLGLIFTEQLYNWLFTNNLTVSEPLSLFDVMQITAIVALSHVAIRSHTKIANLEKRFSDLHQELSIEISSKK